MSATKSVHGLGEIDLIRAKQKEVETAIKEKDTAEQAEYLYRVLKNHPFAAVKRVFIQLQREYLGIKQEQVQLFKEHAKTIGWEEFDGSPEDVPKGYDWGKIGHIIYIRTPQARQKEMEEVKEYHERLQEYKDKAQTALKKAAVGEPAQEKRKTDLSMKMTDKICITCGGQMAYEPICPGCKLGRHGFKGRYVCTEDMDHEFYVLRDGIILPNQGD